MNENFKKHLAKAAVGLTLLVPTVLGATAPLAQNVYAETYTVNNGNLSVGTSNTGTLTVKSGNDHQSMANKQFKLYKIFNAEVSADGKSTNYTFNDTYKAALQKVIFNRLTEEEKNYYNLKSASDVFEYLVIDYMQNLGLKNKSEDKTVEGRYSAYRYFVDDLTAEIKAENIDGDLVKVASADENNSFKITGLSYGYYLVDEVLSDNVNNAASLVLVDTVADQATITLKSDVPQIIKKIREDDNRDQIGANKDGWNDLGDYQIGQTVPYKYDVTIPDMNGYHGYYLGLEDKMDEALTFHADKKQIQVIIKKGDKSYTLKDSEYNLQTIGSNVSTEVKEAKYPDNFADKTDTFGIEITDLKSIVDANFNDMTADHENDYSNLSLDVEYAATLNDKAANATGRPGFENSVRLVYSNNPNNTGTAYNTATVAPGEQAHGTTPWDTVVAFTYRLKGLKVNSNNLSLSGAHFRLYTDDKMKNEVVIKEVDGKYIVVDADSAAGVTGVDVVTDDNGNFVINGLDSGVYYLKETVAPTNYRLLEKPIEVKIIATMPDNRDNYIKGDGATDAGLTALSAQAKEINFFNNTFNTGVSVLPTDLATGTVNITVVNENMSTLPMTGGQLMAVAMVVGAGIVVFSIYAILKKDKKDKKEV